MSGQAVTPASHRDEQVVGASEVHTLHNVGGTRATRDQRRTLVEGAVPDAARGVVALAANEQQGTPQRRAQLLDLAGCQEELLAQAGDRRDGRSGSGIRGTDEPLEREGARHSAGQRGGTKRSSL